MKKLFGKLTAAAVAASLAFSALSVCAYAENTENSETNEQKQQNSVCGTGNDCFEEICYPLLSDEGHVTVYDNDTPAVDGETEVPWQETYSHDKKAVFSVDDETTYLGSEYSIKIENTDLDMSQVRFYPSLKPNTYYVFSAYVKYEGFEPEDPDVKSGATLSMADGQGLCLGNVYHGSEWSKLEYFFITKADTSGYWIGLQNGYYYDKRCKGTAWFTDIKLEEGGEATNEWNILSLIVKNINAPVDYDGQKFTCKNSYSTKDIENIKACLETMKTSEYPLEYVTGGRAKINRIDHVVIEEAVTQLGINVVDGKNNYAPDLSIDPLKKYVDWYLSKGNYQEIIISAPIHNIQHYGGFACYYSVNGGAQMLYKGVYACTLSQKPGSNMVACPKWPANGYVHEMIHGVEYASNRINPDITAPLDESSKEYTPDPQTNYLEFHCLYCACKMKDGKGVDPKAFYRPSKYEVVSSYAPATENEPIPEPPTPVVTGKVEATFGGTTKIFADLTTLAKDKAFKAAAGAVEITINTDLTTPQVFTLPTKATSVKLTAPEPHTVTLKTATLSCKGTLTVENLTLTSGKKYTGLSAKGAVVIKSGFVGAVKASGDITLTDSQCYEDVSMTAKGGSITLSNTTAHKKVTSSGSITLKNGSCIVGAVKATGVLTLSAGTTVKSTANVGGVAVAA